MKKLSRSVYRSRVFERGKNGSVWQAVRAIDARGCVYWLPNDSQLLSTFSGATCTRVLARFVRAFVYGSLGGSENSARLEFENRVARELRLNVFLRRAGDVNIE